MNGGMPETDGPANRRFLPIPLPRADTIPKFPELESETPTPLAKQRTEESPSSFPRQETDRSSHVSPASPHMSTYRSIEEEASPRGHVINPDTALDDPYVADAIQIVNIFDPDGAQSSAAVINILQRVALISWAGGDRVRVYLVQHGMLEKLKDTFMNAFAVSTSLKFLTRRSINMTAQVNILRTYAVLVRGSRDSAAKAFELGWVDILINVLDHSDISMKQWAAHSLFVTMFDNVEIIASIKRQSLVIELLTTLSKSSKWLTWSYNDAIEILKILEPAT